VPIVSAHFRSLLLLLPSNCFFYYAVKLNVISFDNVIDAFSLLFDSGVPFVSKMLTVGSLH